ncbi:MAG: glycosyltransferase 87 family protein [Oscillospiraceae bacterium]|nr:glycosyltransferase 87 family protein [Oscillospiraceae bacterium]
MSRQTRAILSAAVAFVLFFLLLAVSPISGSEEKRREQIGEINGRISASLKTDIEKRFPGMMERLTDPSPERAEKLFMAAAFALLAGGVLFFAAGHIQTIPALAFFIAALVGGMIIRTLSLTQFYQTDYLYCLGPWAQDFRVWGREAINLTRSDYNMPYLYIVGVISKISLNDLYLYKLVSVIFDCGLVLAGLRLANRFSMGQIRKSVLGAALFLAPTVWLNSAYWGQCDAVYAFFCLMALVYALEKRPSLSAVMAAIAFSFKLQTIFFLPVFIVLWMVKRVRWWREIPVFLGTFAALFLPAWVLGRPLSDMILVYANQSSQYSHRLNLNSSSAYALLGVNEPHTILFTAGLVLAFCYLAALMMIAWVYRDRMSDRALFFFVLAFVIGIPWFLPSMHDRYFYLADIFCVVLAVMIPEKWVFAPFCIIGSYAGYHAYLFGQHLNHIGLAGPSLLMLFLLGSAVMLLLNELKRGKPV